MTLDIPVIDLSPFRGGSAGGKVEVAQAVASAWETIGFLVVEGHGVDPAEGADLHASALAFFDLPLHEKLTVRRPRNDQNRGYIPYGEETLARMHGGDTPPDYKEVFAIGPDDIPATPYYTGSLAYPDFAPNLWPAEPVALRRHMLIYYASMVELSRLLARIYAVALDLPEEFFSSKLQRHSSQLRMLHYPVPDQPFLPGQLRCGAHSDLGMTTILRNEAAPGGLEVLTSTGDWVVAPAAPNTFVVNLGDLMMRWSNDRWRSTQHRVAIPETEEWNQSRRLSLGFFVVPEYDAMVECVTGTGGAAKYPPITVRSYRTGRFAAGAGVQPVAE
ncbi:MAG: 2OG-Fe(II) oxygenase [Rhodospirillaceae bacterium]|nr:2OG-Fe(II) oxygenase [Rhodospirillaceae bacterium]